MNCNKCARKVGDSFKSRWNHIVKYHPELTMRGLLKILQNPKGFGEMLGRYAKAKTFGI